jgi:hypothetical protein
MTSSSEHFDQRDTSSSITRELPFNYPYAVKIHYVKRFTAMWPRPAEILFQEVERNFEKQLGQIVRNQFGIYRHGGLEGTIQYVFARPRSEDTLNPPTADWC